jgi:hypothetical protein
VFDTVVAANGRYVMKKGLKVPHYLTKINDDVTERQPPKK